MDSKKNYKLRKTRINKNKIDNKIIIRSILKRDIMIIILLVISLMFVSSPSSFAHLQASETKQLEEVTSSNMEGLLLTNTSINITDLIPSTEGDANNSLVNNCKDSSGETICSLYDFSVRNNENSTKDISFSLVGNYNESTYSYDSIVNTFSNIKFKVFKGEKTSINSSSTSIMTSDILKPNVKTISLPELNTSIEKGQTLTYTIMFWIEKTSDNQAMLDASKTFDANVLVNFTEKGSYGSYEEKLLNGNYPDLSNGLVPIVYNENDKVWQVANISNAWYKYEEQRWANAASLDNRSNYVNDDGTYKYNTKISDNDILAMFVWIPRYSYTIGCISSSCLGYQIEGASTLSTATPGAIDIKFVDKNTKETFTGNAPTYTYTDNNNNNNNRNPSNYYTHPAFDFGGTPLSGIWVGKFETAGINTKPLIKPNVISLRNQSLSVQFSTSQLFSSQKDIYNITGDAHMMKNSEWGAVAYLSQSIYGKYGNSNYKNTNKEVYINNYKLSDDEGYITGLSGGTPNTSTTTEIPYRYNDYTNNGDGTGYAGPGASTTGNIYGIYDMSGGADEYVMAYYSGANTTTWGSYVSGSSQYNAAGFTSKPDSKYFDNYPSANIYTSINNNIGHANYETNGWYNDSVDSLTSTYPWVRRSGSHNSGDSSGLFYGFYFTGKGNGGFAFRITLVK